MNSEEEMLSKIQVTNGNVSLKYRNTFELKCHSTNMNSEEEMLSKIQVRNGNVSLKYRNTFELKCHSTLFE